MPSFSQISAARAPSQVDAILMRIRSRGMPRPIELTSSMLAKYALKVWDAESGACRIGAGRKTGRIDERLPPQPARQISERPPGPPSNTALRLPASARLFSYFDSYRSASLRRREDFCRLALDNSDGQVVRPLPIHPTTGEKSNAESNRECGARAQMPEGYRAFGR